MAAPMYRQQDGARGGHDGAGSAPSGGSTGKSPGPSGMRTEGNYDAGRLPPAPANVEGASKFEKELHSALEQLHTHHETRKLTAIMSSNQDAEFPSEQISGVFSWKGDNTAQNAVYLGIQQQYLFWKHTWMYNDEETQLSEGLPTFNFHLMACLACAMDTYWFSENQQLQLFDWLRDMVSGAELEPLRLENQKLYAESFTCKKRLYELEGRLTSMKQYQNMGGGNMSIPLTVCIVLLAIAVGHIITVHVMK